MLCFDFLSKDYVVSDHLNISQTISPLSHSWFSFGDETNSLLTDWYSCHCTSSFQSPSTTTSIIVSSSEPALSVSSRELHGQRERTQYPVTNTNALDTSRDGIESSSVLSLVPPFTICSTSASVAIPPSPSRPPPIPFCLTSLREECHPLTRWEKSEGGPEAVAPLGKLDYYCQQECHREAAGVRL
jgi:hypothetical protein